MQVTAPDPGTYPGVFETSGLIGTAGTRQAFRARDTEFDRPVVVNPNVA